MNTTTRTRTRAVTLSAETVEQLQRLLAQIDDFTAAKDAAADAADAATTDTEAHERHRDWERACRDESTARWAVVAALQQHLPSSRPA